jgi:hypothetical protein
VISICRTGDGFHPGLFNTIAGNHLMLTSEHTVKTIEQKARKVMGMLKRGVKFTPTQSDVMKMIEKLSGK